jgi:AmiR/NasT family two-component response regulator
VAEVFAVAGLWLATVLGLRGVWDDLCRASCRADRRRPCGVATSAGALLEAEGFDVGEAADRAEAVEAVAVLRPEIVLLDIQLPDVDGLAVAEQLAAAPDARAVVLISSRDAPTYGPRLQGIPARGFIKSGLSGRLVGLDGHGAPRCRPLRV